jgi:tetratricopeptide (TPR) repeat protein
MAKVYNVQQKYDTALICLKKALALNRSMNYAPAIADSYYNLAQTMFLMQKNESAQEYLDSCIYLAERYAVSKDLANYYLLQAEILLSKQANNSALSYLKKSYALAKEAQIPSSISDATRLLHSVYSASGNYEQAYSYLNEFKQMEDSLKTDENITEVTKLEMQYLFDKKEQQLKHEQEQQLLIRENKLKRQQVLLLALLIVMALTVALAIFIIRAINIKNKYRTLELEQKLLQVQMNPHFIFNSLCAIQNAMIENKTNEADLLLTKFARLIRTILENSRLPYVAVESEVETLQNYLDIQKIRFKTNFKYHIEIDEAINTESLAIPPMMAQPFIENAIEHGLLPKKEQGNINIQFAKKNGLIELIIEDNGVGRASMQENKPSYQEKHSLATVLTKERIRAMQKTVNKDAYFEIIDLRQNGHPSGTKVVFCLPYINTY